METDLHLVCIVEDDAAVRASTRALLEASGYATRDFASAEQFLAADSTDDAGCIILDYNLPGVSGIELVETLRAQGCRTPIIIVSSHGKELVARAAKAGVAVVLRKPMAADALIQWLEQIFTAKRQP